MLNKIRTSRYTLKLTSQLRLIVFGVVLIVSEFPTYGQNNFMFPLFYSECENSKFILSDQQTSEKKVFKLKYNIDGTLKSIFYKTKIDVDTFSFSLLRSEAYCDSIQTKSIQGIGVFQNSFRSVLLSDTFGQPALDQLNNISTKLERMIKYDEVNYSFRLNQLHEIHQSNGNRKHYLLSSTYLDPEGQLHLRYKIHIGLQNAVHDSDYFKNVIKLNSYASKESLDSNLLNNIKSLNYGSFQYTLRSPRSDLPITPLIFLVNDFDYVLTYLSQYTKAFVDGDMSKQNQFSLNVCSISTRINKADTLQLKRNIDYYSDILNRKETLYIDSNHWLQFVRKRRIKKSNKIRISNN
jgi:hypothetical protein